MSSFKLVAGADEAGAGALAGPVVAAAVVLGNGKDWSALKDSKVLSPAQRDRLYDEITLNAVSWAVSFVPHTVIDKINILEARLMAMKNAIEMLGVNPDCALIDGNREVAGLAMPVTAIVDGDNLVPEISAASIIAKVSRDRYMARMADEYPEYGFDMHFGYGTPAHKECIERCGPCEIHRKTFAPVRDLNAPELPFFAETQKTPELEKRN